MNKLSRVGKPGFTIVELLIVVVVIAILAAITIVSYNGIQNHAKIASIQADIESSAKQLEAYRFNGTTIGEAYPPNLATANLKLNPGDTAAYSYNVSANAYCLGIVNGQNAYYATSLNTAPQAGTCSPTNGALGWWKMNGNANDSAGSANGTVTTQTLSTGQNGVANAAYTFVGNPMTTSSSALPTGASDRTVLIWAYLTQLTGASWRMADSWGTTATGQASAISISSAGTVSFNGQSDDYVSDLAFPLNQWHLIGYTLSGSQLTLIEDTQTRSTTLPQAANTVNGGTHYIGSWLNSGFGWMGALDDLRIYNRVLSPAEIQSIYAAGAQL